MEFFARVRVPAGPESLQDRLTVASLPQWCASIDSVLEHSGDHGRIYCVWGVFAVERTLIRGGVRFALPGCPNALAWTVTAGLPPDPASVVIHCTINREEQDPDFVETLETFVRDWRQAVASAIWA
jgi:hypothetical protein